MLHKRLPPQLSQSSKDPVLSASSQWCGSFTTWLGNSQRRFWSLSEMPLVRRQAVFLVNDIHFSRRIVNINRSRGCGQGGNPASFAGFPSEVGKSEGLFHGAAFPQPRPPRVFVPDVGQTFGQLALPSGSESRFFFACSTR